MTRLINGNFTMKPMEQRLVECVPNFSEGKDKAIIDSIIQPILDNKSVTLLDIDMGGDFNRTVVTWWVNRNQSYRQLQSVLR